MIMITTIMIKVGGDNRESGQEREPGRNLARAASTDCGQVSIGIYASYIRGNNMPLQENVTL